MPVVTPFGYFRQTMHFTLPSGEVASCGVAWDPGVNVPEISTTVAGDFRDRAELFWDTVKGLYPGNIAFNGSTLSRLGPDGLTRDTAELSVNALPGFGTSGALPTECAIVASLKTTLNNRSGRGRMYLPATQTTAMTGDGRLKTETRDLLANSMADYLMQLVSDGITFVSSVASARLNQLHRVTFVSVGDVFDAQRRRRDSITEVRSVVDVI